MKEFLLISVISLLVAHKSYSQDNLKKHVVQKGENVQQIAQKYKVTPNDLYKANPSLVKGINESDTLYIPKSVVATVVSQPKNPENTAQKVPDEIVYVVQSKETKFGLSKQFGLPIAEIEEQNPHIVNGLQSGHVIRIKGATQNIPTPRPVASVHYGNTISYTVLPGETLYGIAKRNNLTVDELVAANQETLKGILKSGQLINIPSKKEIAYPGNIHIVEAGETKFGLSKRYGISIRDLENLNPHIVRMLQTGQRLNLPGTVAKTTEPVAEKPKETKPVEVVTIPSTDETKKETLKKEDIVEGLPAPADWIDYTILPGETLFGLSRKAGVSIKQLTDVNPKLVAVGVQADMVIKMPKTTTETTTEAAPAVKRNATVAQPVSNPAKNQVRYTDLAKTMVTVEKKQLVIFTPFNESALKTIAGGTSDEKKQQSDFYKGALCAIDSARVIGANVDVAFLEASKDKNSVVMESALKALKRKPNAVILPYYDAEIADVTAYLNRDNIPVITTSDKLDVKENTNRYCAIPSVAHQRALMLQYIQSLNGNVIVVSDYNRTAVTDEILKVIPRAKVITTSEKGVLDVENLKYQLLKDKKNYVILNTDKNGTIITTTNALLSELSNQSITIAFLETGLMPDLEDISTKRFAVLQLIYPSTVSSNRSGFATTFIAQQQKILQSPPSPAFLNGFDITFDTLLRISQDKNFEASAKDDVTEQASIKFDYAKNEKGSYSNQGIYILQYGNDAVVRELK